MQTAYLVLVTSTEERLRANQGDLWDTGKVNSDRSIQVVYRGKQLASRSQVWRKVRVWDKSERPSAWSAPAFWSMGLEKADDWQGKRIGRDSGEVLAQSRHPRRGLRRFPSSLGKKKPRARFHTQGAWTHRYGVLAFSPFQPPLGVLPGRVIL